ncbi:MAG: nickel-dependent lactate racemase [Candidatus Thorarchaeota archaeon]|nr:nickel-dependent lactate racemase [Candidatus Thorarchaeota archaeon]
MKTSILYKGVPVKLEIPESCKVTIIEPKSVSSGLEPSMIIREALESPIDHIRFSEFVSKNNSFLVIVNDHARSTPTPDILREILPYLREKQFRVIVASGTHTSPSESDLREIIFGEYYDELKPKITLHDSRNSKMINLGTTSRGTPVLINAIVNDYDAIIAINSIEPHYFAGFTGGRKSILPGIAAFDTIEANHSMALLDEARLLRLKGNPVHEDLEEAAKMLAHDHPIFAINVVQDGKKRIARVVAGDIFEQLYEGAKTAQEIYAPKIDEPADIVISVVHPPLDQDLYQGAKGFENTRFALRRGGILILVAACPGGIGDESYAAMMTCADSPEEMYEKFKEVIKHYQLGWHKVGSIPPFLAENQFWFVTDIDDDTVEKMHMRPFHDIQTAIDAAIETLGNDINILIVNDAGNVCPVI